MPGVRIVYCCVSRATLAKLSLPNDVAGLVSEYDLAKTMHLATLLQPMARSVVVVAGASEFERQWAATAERQLTPYGSRYAMRTLVGLPMAQLLDELRRVPRDAIVIYTAMFVDGGGKVFDRHL